MAISPEAAEASRSGGTLPSVDEGNVQVAGGALTDVVGSVIRLFRRPGTAKRVEPTLGPPPEARPAIEPELPPAIEPELPPAIEPAAPRTQEDEYWDAQRASEPAPVPPAIEPELPPAIKPAVLRPPRAEESVYDAYKNDGIVGIDFNMSRLDTSAAVKARMNQISVEYADEIIERTGGVVPLSLTRQLADLLGVSDDGVEAAIKSLPSDVADLSVRATVMRDVLVQVGEEVDALARVIARDPTQVTDLQRVEFRQKFAEHAALLVSTKGVQTEIARALSAHRIPAGGNLAARSEAVAELIQNTGGSAVVDELAKRWLATPVTARAKFAAKGWFAKTRAAVFTIWINGLLSGLRTHEINILSNTVFTLWQIPERLGGAAIGALRQAVPRANPDRVRGMEAVDMLHGLVESIPDAFRLAARVFRTDTPTRLTTKLEVAHQRTISTEALGYEGPAFFGHMINYFGVLTSLPGRGLMTMDEFGKAIGTRMELRAQARRLSRVALDEGKTADEAAEIYTNVLRGDVADATRSAEEFADTVTFTKMLGDQGQAFQSFMNKTPGGRIVMPFIRVTANILKESAKRTILAPAMREVRVDFMAGGARRDMALARIGIGTSAMAWASYLAAQGVITGGGPTDPALQAIWREKYQPYSVLINGKWVPYGRLEPIATLFGVAADYADFMKWAPRDIDPADSDALATRAVIAILHNVGQKNFLMGISDFAEAYTDPLRYGDNYVAKLAAGLAQPFYSTMLRDAEAALDPELSETRIDPRETNIALKNFYSLKTRISARTPGLSSDLPDNRNWWTGKPIKAYEGHWIHAFNAFRPRSDRSDAVVDEILRLGMPVARPRRQVEGVRLTPQQYDKLLVLMHTATFYNRAAEKDHTWRQAMTWLVGQPSYKAGTDLERIGILRDLRDKYLSEAGDLLQEEDAELKMRINTAKAMRDVDLRPPR